MTKQNIAWLAFGASLLLNLVFIAGMAWGWSHWGGGHRGWHGGDTEDLAERLDLTSDQQKALEALRERFRERRAERRTGRGERRKLLLAEMSREQFDREAVAALIAQSSTSWQANFVELTAEMHGYLQSLNPEQRTQFLELAAERGSMRRLFFGSRRDRRSN